MGSDRFIPVTKGDILASIISAHPDSDAPAWNELADLISTACRVRFNHQVTELNALYESLDPDRDTVDTARLSIAQREAALQQFVPLFSALADQANYDSVSQSEVDRLLSESQNQRHGLKISVDKSKYKLLKLWTRGHGTAMPGWQRDAFSLRQVSKRALEQLHRRGIRHRALERFKEEPSTVYRRCIVASRVGDRHLLLKLFKDVEKDRVELLLPKIHLSMSDFDRILAGLSMVSVIFAVARVPFLHVDVTSKSSIVILLGIAGLMALRAFTHVQNARNKYLARHSRTLYYQMVSSNRGVITLLANRAEEEEFKELLVAYNVLVRNRGSPLTQDQLTLRAETWLAERFNVYVNFDTADAVRKLQQFGLMPFNARPDALRAVKLDVAVESARACLQEFRKAVENGTNQLSGLA